MAFIGYLNGLGWSGRFGWSILYTALFVVAITYVVSFVWVKSKLSWLVAGVVAGLTQILLFIPAMVQQRTVLWEFMPVWFFEWFVVGTVAGLIAMQIPTHLPPRAKGTYY